MKVINIQEAKTHLSRLVDAAANNEDIVIAKAGKPLVRLIPFAVCKLPRKLGALAGKIKEAEDCWATDPELENLFYGEIETDRESLVAEDPR